MNILKKVLEIFKNIFTKKEKIVMLNEGENNLTEKRKTFKEGLKIKIPSITENRRKVETHICYGDGLGIKKKIEY